MAGRMVMMRTRMLRFWNVSCLLFAVLRGTMSGVQSAEISAQRLQILGDQSLGFIWPSEEEEPSSDSEDEGDDPYEHPRNKRLLQLGRTFSNLSASTSSLSTLSKASSSPASTAADSDSDASLPDIPSMSLGTGPSAAFTAEAQSTLQRGYEEGYDVLNIGTEMGLLFPAYNAGVDAARKEIVDFILSKINIGTGGAAAAAVLGSATKLFTHWKPIFPKFSSDPLLILLDIQAYVVDHPDIAGWFGILLRGAYEADLVDEVALVRWREDGQAQGKSADIQQSDSRDRWAEVWKKGKVYVDVLEQMDSDDDDDDDNEEEEDDGSEDE